MPHVPEWLREESSASPFEPSTRAMLRERAARDPHLVTLLDRMANKSPDESRDEWVFAQRMCREGPEILAEIHQRYESPTATVEDEQDVLQLAGYMAPDSYAHFFEAYKGDKEESPLSREEKEAYANALRILAPYVARLQPEVAVQYAPLIREAFWAFDLASDAHWLMMDIAQIRPDLILANPDKLATYSHGDDIMRMAAKIENGTYRPQPRIMIDPLQVQRWRLENDVEAGHTRG